MAQPQPINRDNPIPHHRGLPCPHPNATDSLALALAHSVHTTVTPAATILFGSRARGDHTEPKSDIDILIITEDRVSNTQESMAERSAKDLAAKLYGREMKAHLVWILLKEFERDRPFINSISTNAILDGLVLSNHPEHFNTPYASDPPPPSRYDWSGYQRWLNASRELLVLIKTLLDPREVLWQTIPDRYADTIHRIPDMTEKHRTDVIRHNIPEMVKAALKAAIKATGGFSKLRAPTHELAAILQKELSKQGIDAEIPTAVRNCPLPYQDLPMPNAAIQAITDTESLRQTAIRTRRRIANRSNSMSTQH